MSELKPLVCPQCGGHINRSSRKCEYCGTEYDFGYDNILHFEAIHPGTHILQSQAVMTEEMVRTMGSKEAGEYILRRMAQEMAEHIIPMMDVRTEFDPMLNQMRVKSRLRVIDPTFRF